MLFHFYLKYKTHYGQSVFIEWLPNNKNDTKHQLALEYFNEDYWKGSLEIPNELIGTTFYYRYYISENGIITDRDLWNYRQIEVRFTHRTEIAIYDNWQNISIESKVFKSSAFVNVLSKAPIKVKQPTCRRPTHIFQLHCVELPYNKTVCLLPYDVETQSVNISTPTLLRRTSENIWTVELDLRKEKFPFYYKYAVFDLLTKKLEAAEDNEFQIVQQSDDHAEFTILNQFADFHKSAFRGAGVNIQLSSLKSENSWGVGDLTDLNQLSDWASIVGLKMIQLLPLNDTTASHTIADSYPYAPISVHALHLIILDVEALSKKFKIKLHSNIQQEANRLNAAATLEYPEVMNLKSEAIKIIFDHQFESFTKDSGFIEFYNHNQFWLIPYAAFCYLRDKNKTADFSKWYDYSIYDEESIFKLTATNTAHYRDIAIHYFIQYHLHLQLQFAVAYAHKLGIILKGDLPIGVGRYSVETWKYPNLFHVEVQSGAPPDAFTVKGQNWSFPTYNWDNMKKDNFLWWRQRLQHLNHYFDAIRIDHVLGFFRIWSIPMHAVEGILGYFVPALGITSDEVRRLGMAFDEQRLCRPFITEAILYETFGKDINWVKENVISIDGFREEFNTQRKIAKYFSNNNQHANLKQKLFDLLANVILIRDEVDIKNYHFRINMQDTTSYKLLSDHDRRMLNILYFQYFFQKQNHLWSTIATEKLDAIQSASDMLICAEDLGMVPEMVEGDLKLREILTLQVQRMPKLLHESFSNTQQAPYLSVATSSTHDMSTLRQWWKEDKNTTQDFFNNFLNKKGVAPDYCTIDICKQILLQHLDSPAMWSVFLLQDLLSINIITGSENPADERINNPADPNHYWNYRMHLTLDLLIILDDLNNNLKEMITSSGRSN